MKLYKFRSLNNSSFVFDIFINQRLYCASYESLNDPFEGQFIELLGRRGGGLGFPSMGGMRPLGIGIGMGMGGVIRRHQSIKNVFTDQVKICSLSEEFFDVRLWAHYAEGHEGLAIEIEFDGDDENLVKVEYSDGLRKLSRSALTNSTPKELLMHKTKHWDYEKEWRLVQEESFYDISGKITAIYLGCRISPLNRTVINKILPDEIPIFETNLNRNTISIQAGIKIDREKRSLEVK